MKCSICLNPPTCALPACSKGHLCCADCLYELATRTRVLKVQINGAIPSAVVVDRPFKCPECREETEIFQVSQSSAILAPLLPFIQSGECRHCDKKLPVVMASIYSPVNNKRYNVRNAIRPCGWRLSTSIWRLSAVGLNASNASAVGAATRFLISLRTWRVIGACAIHWNSFQPTLHR